MNKFFISTLAVLAICAASHAQITGAKALQNVLPPESGVSATDPAPNAYGYLMVREHGATMRAPIISVFHENDGTQYMYFIVTAVKDTTTYELLVNPTGLGGIAFDIKAGGPNAYLTIFDATAPLVNPPQFDTLVPPPSQPNATKNGTGAFNIKNGRISGVFHMAVSDGKRAIKLDGAFNAPS